MIAAGTVVYAPPVGRPGWPSCPSMMPGTPRSSWLRVWLTVGWIQEFMLRKTMLLFSMLISGSLSTGPPTALHCIHSAPVPCCAMAPDSVRPPKWNELARP